MSWISEKKARELLAIYMQAELKGEDQKALETETVLRNGGWKITMGPDGMTVRKESSFDTTVSNYLLPKESNIAPYNATGDIYTGGNGKALWISIGIAVSVLGLIAFVVYLIKTKRNARIEARQ